jgi:hypothetical protein
MTTSWIRDKQLFACKTSAAEVFVFHQKHQQLTAIFPAARAKNL